MPTSAFLDPEPRIDRMVGFPHLNAPYVIRGLLVCRCYRFTKYHPDTQEFDVIVNSKWCALGETTSKGRMSLEMAREVLRSAD